MGRSPPQGVKRRAEVRPTACYVNPFVRGTPTPAGLRFSSTVVRGIEIAVFVAKRDTVASVFDRIPSLQGGGFAIPASVAATVVVASAGAGERRQRQSGPRRRPATPTCDRNRPPSARSATGDHSG